MMLTYKFGLLAPVEGASLVHDQMWAAHRYRNTLVEIERARRAALRDAESRFGLHEAQSAVDAADAAAEAAGVALSAWRREARSRTAPPALTEALKTARAALKTARASFSARRAELRESGAYETEKTRIEELATRLKKDARAISGVYWGTYNLVDAAMKASAKLPLYDGGQPCNPDFVRWEHEGEIGAQIQNGDDVAEILGEGHRQVFIGPAVLTAAQAARRERECGADTRRVGKGARQARSLHIRVGSQGRDPVWAVFPMQMHREFPAGSRIKTATVHLRRVGRQEQWSVTLVAEMPESYRRDPDAPGDGAVALHIGWRALGDEMRVAVTLAEGDEAPQELRLTARQIGGFAKVNDLRSIRDKNFGAARDALAAGLKDAAPPEWFVEATRFVGQWRSADRLERIVRRWRLARWDGDAALYEAAEAWRYHDEHLLRWESNQRENNLQGRREVYRRFAADLARRYSTLVIGDFDLREVARRPATEEEADNDRARSNRQIAAVSELRGACVSAFEVRRKPVVKLTMVNDTKRCNPCGDIGTWDAAASLRHRCAACGAEWDQDHNALRNALALYRERPRDGETAEAVREDENTNSVVRVRGGAWAKARSAAKEKAAQKQAARAEAQNLSE